MTIYKYVREEGGGGNSTPGGSNDQIQFNDGGTFGGDTGFTTDGAGNLEVTGSITTTGYQDIDDIRIDGNTIFPLVGPDLKLYGQGVGGTVEINDIKYPTADGTNQQVIVTDGAGNLSFANQTGSGGSGPNVVGIVTQSNPTTFTGRTIVSANTSVMTIADGNGVSGNPTLTMDPTLVAWAGYNSNGLLTQTAADTFTARTIISANTGALTITDGNGVGGNPTITTDPTLVALAGFNSNGILTQTAADTFTARTITTTANAGLVIGNGNGVSGNPTVNMDINNTTDDTTPEAGADYVLTYDNSASATKKTLIKRLIEGETIKIRSNVTQNLTNNTYLTISMATVVTNTTAFNTFNNTSITIPFSGTYLIDSGADITPDSAVTGFYEKVIFVNNSGIYFTRIKAANNFTVDCLPQSAVLASLSANDLISMQVRHNTGANNTTVAAGVATYVQIFSLKRT